jgi:hypothetical protein
MTGVDPPCHWHDNQVPGGRAEANPGLSVAWPVQRLPIPPLPGGALDGIKEPKQCFVICGGGEMENHFECRWDLFRSIPSLEIEGASGSCPRNAGGGALVS